MDQLQRENYAHQGKKNKKKEEVVEHNEED